MIAANRIWNRSLRIPTINLSFTQDNMKPHFSHYTLAGVSAAMMALTACLPTIYGADKKAPRISLDALAGEVQSNNPELKFYQAEIEAAKGGRKQSGIYENPELSTELGGKRVKGGGAISDGVAWGVSLVQTFEYPGRIALRKAIANQDIKLAELGLQQFSSALDARARLLGFRLIISHQKAAATSEVANRLQDLRDALVERNPAGITPLLELRIVEASVVTFRKQAIDANQELQKALFDINLLRGKALDSPLELSYVELAFPKIPSLDSLLAGARMGNFEILMRKAELEQQGFELTLNENQRWPSVSVGPYFSQETAGDREFIGGIGVSLPLPFWNRNAGNIEIAKARGKQAEVSLYLVQLGVEQSVMETYLSFQLHSNEMGLWQKNSIQQFREAADLGDRHYRLGALPIATYIELQREYLDALDSILSVQVETLDSLLRLRVLTQMDLGLPSQKGDTQE